MPARVTDVQGFLELVAGLGVAHDWLLRDEVFLDAFANVVPGNEAEIRSRLSHHGNLADLSWTQTSNALRRLLDRPAGGAARMLWGHAHPRADGPSKREAISGSAAAILRSQEAYRSERCAPAPLLAFPTDGAGFIDPEALAERLEAGHGPIGPMDREQALLRLPHHAYAGPIERRLRDIGGEDALWFADRLASGPLAPPRFTRVTTTAGAVWSRSTGRPSQQIGSPLLWGPRRASVCCSRHSPPLTAPGQRDLVAALAAMPMAQHGFTDIDALAALGHCEGPAREPTEVALAYAAGADDAASRVAAVDAILAHLATGVADLDVAAQGWSLVLPSPSAKLGRWHGVLQQVAASSVAGAGYAWAVLREVLGGRFEELGRRSGFADLVGLAAESALVVGATGTLPGLDDAAERRGHHRSTVEAKRLRTVLQGLRPSFEQAPDRWSGPFRSRPRDSEPVTYALRERRSTD